MQPKLEHLINLKKKKKKTKWTQVFSEKHVFYENSFSTIFFLPG